MTERPVIFNDEMVRAILDGRKTQTRRVVKGIADNHDFKGFVVCSSPKSDEGKALFAIGDLQSAVGVEHVNCPFGRPGDRLYVRECHAQVLEVDIPGGRPVGPVGTMGATSRPDLKSRYVYRADGEMPDVQWHHIGDRQPVRWTPSIHMPRKAARILLDVSSVRVERLHAISEADARAEGVIAASGPFEAQLAFHELWRSIYGRENWQANPWVWVVEFKQVQS
ncbi:MAG: hypothetical protein ACRDCY_22140 [Aeromonas veronii]